MAIRIVRLGSPRAEGEALRIGTVRRPPRGVPRSEIARRDFYDVWLPEVAPSEALVKLGQQAVGDPPRWRVFARRHRREMKRPEASRLLDLLVALSHATDLDVRARLLFLAAYMGHVSIASTGSFSIWRTPEPAPAGQARRPAQFG